MSRLIAAFIRHGEYHQLTNTPSALQPFALTEKGKQQAQRAAELLVNQSRQAEWKIYPVIDCSSLLRAWQTAHEIKTIFEQENVHCCVIESFADLCERSVGSVANLNIDQIEAILNNDPRFATAPEHWKSNSHYCLPFPGAESLMDAGLRVAQHLTNRLINLKRQIETDTLMVFVGHGASFRHAAYHLGILKFDQIAQLSMYHAQPIYLELQADTSLKHIAGKWKIRKPQEHFTD